MGKYWNKPPRVSSWRKISVGMWKTPADPSIYGYETVDVDDLLDYLDAVSQACGEKVTLTAFMVKVVGDTLAKYPDLNAIVIGNRVLRRESADVFVQVAIPNDKSGQADLSGVKLRNANSLDVVDIASILRDRATRVRDGQDEEIEQTKSMIDKVPSALMPTVLKTVDLLTYVVPFDLDKFGIRSDPFGSAMVTNCASFDIRHGFAPLVPMSRCPIVILMGAVTEEPFAYDGKVVARRAVRLGMTCDHRCFDGYQVGQFVRSVRGALNNPRDFYPTPEHWNKAAPEQSETESAAEPAERARASKKSNKRTPEATTKIG